MKKSCKPILHRYSQWVLHIAIGMSIFLSGSGKGIADEANTTSAVVEVGKLTFEFADPDTARSILAKRDDFMNRLSQFDLQSRVHSADKVTLDQYVKFVAAEVLPWKAEQVEKLTGVLRSLEELLAPYSFQNLTEIQLIQTSGREESGAAYTRSSAIILTKSQINMPVPALRKLVLHEMFHVISRSDPKLRDALYSIIGFTASNEIELPLDWKSRRITNPDAPVIKHVMKVRTDQDETVFVAPVLFAKSAYDPQQASSMFAYLEFALMQVQAGDDGQYVAAIKDGEPVMLPKTLPDFHRQIGANTKYIIHPEEVLADNFSELILQTPGLSDPWILEKMDVVLRSKD